MDLPTLQGIAATNQWSAIGPELVLGCLALALLGLGFWPRAVSTPLNEAVTALYPASALADPGR